jgi:hypothetical protein
VFERLSLSKDEIGPFPVTVVIARSIEEKASVRLHLGCDEELKIAELILEGLLPLWESELDPKKPQSNLR